MSADRDTWRPPSRTSDPATDREATPPPPPVSAVVRALKGGALEPAQALAMRLLGAGDGWNIYGVIERDRQIAAFLREALRDPRGLSETVENLVQFLEAGT